MVNCSEICIVVRTYKLQLGYDSIIVDPNMQVKMVNSYSHSHTQVYQCVDVSAEDVLRKNGGCVASIHSSHSLS